MTTYRANVPGNPLPWERARIGNGRHFKPKRTREWQAWVQANCGRLPCLTGPLKLSLAFYRATGQPCDIDNLAKLVQDALNGKAYADDRQIVQLSALKAIDRQRPRTEIEIEEVEAP